MVILGIDPGSVICGYGVIKSENKSVILEEYGVINVKAISDDLYLRINEIHKRTLTIIERTKPELACFETVFYSKNIQSLIKLSHARAAALLACLNMNIPIVEYSPKEIKKSVTGSGAASKEKVEYMVKNILKIDETHKFKDATDALAVALCCAYKGGKMNEKKDTWSEFLENNKDRIL